MSITILKNKEKLFKKEWLYIEKVKKKPLIYKKLISIDYKEFIFKIIENNPKFVKETVESIYRGDLYILKNAFNKKEVEQIIDGGVKFFKSKPSKFHKMIEDTPNFHRWINRLNIKKYSIKAIKHSMYLFNWNKDVSKIRKIISEVCNPLKVLGGLSADQYTFNTPKKKIIERIQLVRYPPGGYIEPHCDNNELFRIVISGYLSKRGVSYKKGGFYLTAPKKKLDLENYIDEGDIGFFYPSLRHGLKKIDPEKKAIKNKKNGRWWFGFNMHHSDLVKNRSTSAPLSLDLKKY